MGRLTCHRCGAEGDGLERAPLPGDAGRRVLDSTCRDCWEWWKGEQVKLINEEGLSPANPEHYQYLLGEMLTRLGLD